MPEQRLSADAAVAAAAARVPFSVDGRHIGSVARAHLDALRAWPQALRCDDEGVALIAPAARRDAVLAEIHAALRAQGLIRAWRDEIFPLLDPGTGQRLGALERAAARFWGTLTLGAHATGYVRDANGAITHLWIAQRSPTKATDPDCYDNLVSGGVPDGQTPYQALLREGWEEAGLSPGQMRGARPGRVLRLERAVAEGHQLEDLHGYDLELPADLQPRNQDGEVARFICLPVNEARALAQGRFGDHPMTADAALITLDFALRHGLLHGKEADVWTERLFACAVGHAQTT